MWQRQGNAVVVTLPRQLIGGDQAIEITDEVRQLVASGIEHIIFDCSAVELINSSGLGMARCSACNAAYSRRSVHARRSTGQNADPARGHAPGKYLFAG